MQENDNVNDSPPAGSTLVDNSTQQGSCTGIANLDRSDDSYENITENIDNKLNWVLVIQHVSPEFDNYTLMVEGYISPDGENENVSVWVWNVSTSQWEQIGTENLTGVEKTLTKVIDGSDISNYLVNGHELHIRFFNDNADLVQTSVHVDLCIVMENVTYTSGVKLQVSVSADNVTWSDNLGPDGPSSYFDTPSTTVNLENIPIGRYIRYVVYFSSENGQLLSGANGPVLDNVIINFTRPTHLISPADDNETGDNTPTFSWENRAPNALFYRLVIDNDPNFADGENEYDNANIPGVENSITIENELPEGVWYWKVQVKSSGGWGPWSEVYRFVVDTTPPSAPVVSSSTHAEGVWTNDANPSFSWTKVGGPSSVTYYYKLEGYDADWRTTDSTSVSYENLPDGVYTFKLYACDTGGPSPVALYEVKIDTSAPITPSVTSPTHAEGAKSNNTSPIFSWDAVGGPSPVAYSYMLYPYETSWKETSDTSVAYSGIPDGTYTFKLKARDVGGESDVVEYTFTIDTTPSTVTLTGPLSMAAPSPTGWTYTSTRSTLELSGRVEPGSRVEVNHREVPVAPDGSFSLTLNLLSGTNTFEIKVTDAAGNVTTKTLTVNYSPAQPAPAAPALPTQAYFIISAIAVIGAAAGLLLVLRRG